MYSVKAYMEYVQVKTQASQCYRNSDQEMTTMTNFSIPILAVNEESIDQAVFSFLRIIFQLTVWMCIRSILKVRLIDTNSASKLFFHKIFKTSHLFLS